MSRVEIEIDFEIKKYQNNKRFKFGVMNVKYTFTKKQGIRSMNTSRY